MRHTLRFFLGFALAIGANSSTVASPKGLQFVQIRNISFQVEVVRSSDEWMKGLMFRDRLGEKEGMLFFGKEVRRQSFWMKNTPVSLDIIYISKDLRIDSIQKNTEPLSEKPLPSKGPALHVLEIVAGSSDRHGFREGDKVIFRGIPR